MTVDPGAKRVADRIRFSVFEVDLATGELYRKGRVVPLQQQPFQVLAALLESPGELVTREELRRRLWPEDEYHEFDDGLNTAVLKVRQALGDSARSPRFVETLAGRGYRFLAPLEGVEGAASPAGARSLSGRSLAGLAAGLVATAAVGYFLLRERGPRPQPQPQPLRLVSTRPLTTAPGLEHSPCFTPDGQRVVYASDQLGEMDVWMRQIAGGPPVVLTPDHPGYDDHPRVSPDGTRIAFASTASGGGIFVTTSLGGPPRKVAAVDFAPSATLAAAVPTLDWSPDGEALVYAVGLQRARGLFVVDLAEGRIRRLPVGEAVPAFAFTEPAWSPDGRRIAFVALAGAATTNSRIWTVDPQGRHPRPMTSGTHHDRHPTWSAAGSGLFFVSDRGGTADVWMAPLQSDGVAEAEPVAVTAGVGVGQIAVSPDGGQMVYVKVDQRSNLWSGAIGESGSVDLSRAEALFRDSQRTESVAVSRDGRWLAFESDRTGNMEIWVSRTDGTDLRRITEHPAPDWYPSFSPDGDRVVFHSLRDGNRELYVVPVAGGPVRRLTEHPARDWIARWSPSGDEIVFNSERSGNPDVWLVSSRGGEPRSLTTDPANDHNPVWTPDGEAVVFTSDRTGASELYRVYRRGGEPQALTDSGWLDLVALDWSAEGSAIYAWGLPRREGIGGFWAIAGRTTIPLLTAGHAHRKLSAALASDGERLYFPVWEQLGDLRVADLARNEE